MVSLIKKNLHFVFVLLLCVTLLLGPTQLLANNKPANMQTDSSLYNTKNYLQPEKNQIKVTVIIPLLQRFYFFSASNRLTARIIITVNMEETALDSYFLDLPVATVINCPQTIQQNIYRLDGKTTRMNFIIPNDLKNFTIELSMLTPIWMIFYRSYSLLAPIVVSSNIQAMISYELQLILLSKSKFLIGYPLIEDQPGFNFSSSIEKNKLEQTIFKVKGIFPMIKVAWESIYWDRNALLITGFLVAILISLFLTPGQLKRRIRFQKISIGFSKAIVVKNKIVEKITNRSTINTHIKLMLTLSMIMVSIPLTVGEDPRTNILVLTSMPVEKEIEQIAAQTSNKIKTYTIADEYNDLPIISRMQFFDALVIGDFELTIFPMDTSTYEVQSIEHIRTKIILDQYKSTPLAAWVLETYQDVIIVHSQVELVNEFNNLVNRNKALLEWDRYIRIIQIEAILSLLSTILLVTTIIVYLMENNDENVQTNLARTIIITIFAFSFLQSVFLTVSRLVVPLSTHAGGTGITAISYIGPFGGGSMPRMACAIFGFIFAFASAGKKHGREISWKLFLAFIVTGLVLIVNPLTGGQFVWAFLLDLTGGSEMTQQKTIAISLIEDHIASIMGSAVLGFYRSRGIMLFFAGIIPLLVLGRSRKYTTTALIFVCAIITGWGAMRIGQMLAYTFFASIIPGIVMGIIFALPFLFFSILEEKIGDYYRGKVF